MGRLLRVFAVIAFLGGPLALRPESAGNGSIRGRVEVRAERTANARPDTSGLGMPASREGTDRRRSVVYLESAPQSAFETREQPRARMDQRNEQFVPHLLAITAGTWVDFPNDDRTYHSVFSLSKSNSFDLGRYAAGHTKSIRFQNSGVVRVFCDIHPNMSAFIVVFAHRYFAVTDDDGHYKLENVPPGTYTVTVWNETVRGDLPSKVVTIGDNGGEVDADFRIQ